MPCQDYSILLIAAACILLLFFFLAILNGLIPAKLLPGALRVAAAAVAKSGRRTGARSKSPGSRRGGSGAARAAPRRTLHAVLKASNAPLVVKTAVDVVKPAGAAGLVASDRVALGAVAFDGGRGTAAAGAQLLVRHGGHRHGGAPRPPRVCRDGRASCPVDLRYWALGRWGRPPRGLQCVCRWCGGLRCCLLLL